MDLADESDGFVPDLQPSDPAAQEPELLVGLVRDADVERAE